MNTITIKNRAEIVEELTEMLMDLDKACKPYETDIYLYYDEATETAELKMFENVGGNSWLCDDHITLYRDEPHTEDNMFDCREDIAVMAEFAGFSEEQLEQLVAGTKKYLGYDEDDEVELDEVLRYISECETNYMEQVCKAHDAYIDACKDDYIESAESILSEFEEAYRRDGGWLI